jgi:sulfatase maturation enzyme AslB (radical SAM superfamily)
VTVLLVLVLTHQCDLACDDCYAGEKTARAMPLSVGRTAIARALQAVEPGGSLRLGLFGGEPSLAWDTAGRPLAREARERAAAAEVALSVSLTTNGTHLDARRLDELARGARRLPLVPA